MPQDEAILVPPYVVDPTEADPSEKPPLAAQRLAGLEQVINYERRYARRFKLVMEWLLSFGVPASFRRITCGASNPGNPSQSYVNQSLEFLDAAKVVVCEPDVTLLLRDPRLALSELAQAFGLSIPDGTRFPEPEPPADIPKPCPFNPDQPDFRDPATRMPDSDSVGYNPGDTWIDPATGDVWQMERAWSWFAPYHRWRKVG